MRMENDFECLKKTDGLDGDEKLACEAVLNASEECKGVTGAKPWTIAMRRAFVVVGQKRKYYVNAHRCESDASEERSDGAEWLWDLCWFELDDSKHIVRAPLIMECEWSRNSQGLHGDFAKLVVGRAEHRVFIFDTKNQEAREQEMAWFLDEITTSACTQAGDRYLLFWWDRSSGTFLYKHLIA
jgi:predicted nucleic acid-binding Zn finger protein